MLKLKLILSACAVAVLGACGGSGGDNSGSSTPPTAPAPVQGAWSATSPANDSYEFLGATSVAPYSGLKTGRVFRAGQFHGLFYWALNADGSIKITQVQSSCEKRPIDLCPAASVATVAAGATAAASNAWTVSFDDNADGVADRVVKDTYTRAGLDLASLAEGEFLMSESSQFEQPLLGYRTGNQIAMRLVVLGKPVPVYGSVAAAAAGKASFAGAGEAGAVTGSANFTMTDGTVRSLPVKSWVENVVMTGGLNHGFIVEYDVRRKLVLPSDVPAASVQIGDYETLVQKRAGAYARIDKFIPAPAIKPGDRFSTFLPVDFNQAWVLNGAGNELVFTSATAGTLSHTDFHGGEYSESRTFSWERKDDGSLLLKYPSGLAVQMRFVADIKGGYSVVYTIPHPLLGTGFFQHDLIADATPILTEASLPGRYEFISSDRVTKQAITLHKDGRVSGVVGGFWFRDAASGDFVGFECIDLAGREISDYDTCYAQLNDTSKVDLVHVRRLRFLHQNGNEFLLKYNAAVYGEQFGVKNRDYLTIALTYRFVRVGDE